MKKVVSIVTAFAFSFFLLFFVGYRKSEFVILSTNDMHASLDNMSRLATAVKECRDTVFTIVVDAGDRWTGNAYVDLAEGRLPIIRLMNAVGYDVATLGNHDFDAGQKVLDEAIDKAEFDVVCANMQTMHYLIVILTTLYKFPTYLILKYHVPYRISLLPNFQFHNNPPYSLFLILSFVEKYTTSNDFLFFLF